MGPPRDNPELDPLAILHLDNLTIYNYLVGLAVVDIQKLSTLLSRFVNQSFCCFYTFLIENRQFLEPVDTKAIPF